MSYGLAAAGAWGLSAVAAVNASRQIGVYLALLGSQLLGILVLAAVAILRHPTVGGAGTGVLLGLAGGGILGLAGWLSYYMALRRGPAGPVTAISASYGGVAALAAAVLLREQLAGPGLAGIAAATGGVVLIARRSGHARPAARHARPRRLRPGAMNDHARPALP